MPKGHSYHPGANLDLLYLLDREPHSGKQALAAIALSHATDAPGTCGYGEKASRRIVRMLHRLRHEHGYTDSDILRLLSLPEKVAQRRHE